MKFALLMLLLAFCAFTNAQTDMASHHYMDPCNPEFEPNEILVKFVDDAQIVNLKSANGAVQTGMALFDQFAAKHSVVTMEKVFPNAVRLKSAKLITINGETIEAPQLHNIYKLKAMSISDMKAAVAEMQAQPNVEFAEPNYYVYSQGNEDALQPNDPLISSQWHLQAINAQQAWNKEPTGGAGQIISIIDTGVDWTHPDLDDNIWTNNAELNGVPGVDDDGNGFIDDIRGWDWVNQDNNPMDDNSHGTHVAGIAAAEKNNSVGISGVAFGAKIMPLKVLQSSGRGNSSDLAAAINYAADNGATVINMSLGSYGESLTVKAVLEDAYSTALPVAAAGNDGLNIEKIPDLYYPFFPACYNFVIGVQASDYDNELTKFSNFDPSGPILFKSKNKYNYEIIAPGERIFSTIPSGNYRAFNGTSMASPVVSGTIALLKKYENLSNEQILSKLIHCTTNVLNADNALDYVLSPDLYFESFTVSDHYDNGDWENDVDAGETIEIWLTVKNAGGQADSVYANLSLGEFEDPSVATIKKSTQYIGDISCFATLTGEADSFKVDIDPNVVHGRDIVFEYEIGCRNSNLKKNGEFIITVNNGNELVGMNSDTLLLTPNKHWIITGSFMNTNTGVINILPGTKLTIGTKLRNQGKIIGIGNKDSIIFIDGSQIYADDNGGYLDLSYCSINLGETGDPITDNTSNIHSQKGEINNSTIIISNGKYRTAIKGVGSSNRLNFTDCILKNFSDMGTMADYANFVRCNITYMDLTGGIIGGRFNTLQYNNISKIDAPIAYGANSSFPLVNNILTGANYINIYTSSNTLNYYDYMKNMYWGTTDSLIIEKKLYDFLDDSKLARLVYSPYFKIPSNIPHGCVWKVEVNEVDPQDEHLDPVGAEELKFDVYFNKCMDTLYTPQLSFGVREPYTQRIVSKNGKWSADSTIWTAYYDVGLDTGDGINQIRVTEAVDTAGFEIPIEVERFQFIIQAAGAASLAFQATPGIGKVDLEWPSSTTDDVLGYNLYRCYNLTDSTYSDTILINTSLIVDTTFVDTHVIPDTTYHYLYKTVGTDMQETDYSKSVTATPFNAANGDANGDLSVNVADIITIVNYLLGNNPQPFLMDAADVNYDGDINVLDIVSVVNLIMTPAANSDEMTAMMAGNAEISMENDTVYVNSTAELAGLQFTLADISTSEEVKVLKALSNFEVIRSYRDGKLLILAYSLSGQVLPSGKTAILSLSNPDAWIFDAVLSNTGGNAVDFDILENATATPTMKLTYGFQLGQNYPNPFTNSTIIPFNLDLEVDEVILSIYDVSGKQIKTWQLNHPAKGEHKVEWQTSQKPGIYIYTLNVLKQGHSSFYQSKRMIVK